MEETRCWRTLNKGPPAVAAGTVCRKMDSNLPLLSRAFSLADLPAVQSPYSFQIASFQFAAFSASDIGVLSACHPSGLSEAHSAGFSPSHPAAAALSGSVAASGASAAFQAAPFGFV
jgi:hypothetical protein